MPQISQNFKSDSSGYLNGCIGGFDLPCGPVFRKNQSFKTNYMSQVKSGDKVKVHYHGKLTSGETFDSSAGREPLEFEVGSGSVIPGFDEGVTGMTIGEKENNKYSLY